MNKKRIEPGFAQYIDAFFFSIEINRLNRFYPEWFYDGFHICYFNWQYASNEKMIIRGGAER